MINQRMVSNYSDPYDPFILHYWQIVQVAIYVLLEEVFEAL
jgi:hypothetical protein